MERKKKIRRVLTTLIMFVYLSVSAFGQTSLDSTFVLSAKQNKFHHLKHLLRHNTAFNISNENGATALLWAIYNDNFKMLNYLIKHKATFSSHAFIRVSKNNLILSLPLSVAALRNDTTMAGLLISKFKQTINSRNYNVSTLSASGVPALFTSIQNKTNLMFDYLMSKDADVNLVDMFTGNTPLMEAVIYPNFYAFSQLIKRGAKLNVQNSNGQTALHIALANNLDSFAKLLIKSGARINLSDDQGFTPIMYAMANYNLEITKLLINDGANINAVNKFGLKAIDYVDKSKDADFYEFVYLNTLSAIELYSNSYFELLENKISLNLLNLNQRNTKGETLLHIAILDKDFAMVKFLLLNGIDVNLMDNNYNTALDLAKNRQNNLFIKILKESGARESYALFSPEIRQNYLLKKRSKTVFGAIFATKYNSNSIDSIILNTTILSKKDIKGNNLMHSAVYRNRADIVKKLLLHNFSGDRVNNKAYSPYDIAVLLKNKKIILFFNQFGIPKKERFVSEISADSLFEVYTKGNKTDIKKFVLANKLSINLPSFSGFSLNEKIMEKNDRLLMNFMVSNGITPMVTPKNEYTPLVSKKLYLSGAYKQSYFDLKIKRINASQSLSGANKKLFSINSTQL